MGKSLIGVLSGRDEQGRVSRLGMGWFVSFQWALESRAPPSCLVPGSGATEQGDSGPGCKTQTGVVAHVGSGLLHVHT